ncbi:MAG: orotate phosphoribosyltransferase [Deltaproteobacteria bacterium]
MKSLNEKLVAWLFETKAIRVCPENNPFWYTSGTIGPYYINTHFLVGSEEKANEILELINNEKSDKYSVSKKLLDVFSHMYYSNRIYKALIDSMCEYVKNAAEINEIDYISGGERRDWFFSFMIAKLLNKPHITIFKDLDAVVFDGEKSERMNNLNNSKVLHIADLVTEASSFERAWIPAVEELNAKMEWNVVVVDRNQGGKEFFKSRKINAYSMIDVDKELFKEALAKNFINSEQYSMICDYIDNPKDSMKAFIKNHPEFLKNALAADEKTKERASLCLEKNIYEI